jgi:hypothetical protein
MSLILLRREGETLVQLLTRLDYLLREGPSLLVTQAHEPWSSSKVSENAPSGSPSTVRGPLACAMRLLDV